MHSVSYKYCLLGILTVVLVFNTVDRVAAKDLLPDWPKTLTAPAGAPNIVLILLDDIGFGDTSTFGGEAKTPELDRLADQGLRYNNFNTTGKCSPTRAALLTGRNHHRVGFGDIVEAAAGYPGYDSVWKDSAASIAEVLRRHGYSTSAFGKWHNTPTWEITSTGPFDRWPTGRGFEYFYGFMGGIANQWEPTNLYRNTLPVDAPRTPEQSYHLTADITDEAIQWVAQHLARAPERPYFLYFATGAVHSPHHAPREWIERYRGKFARGWDSLNAEIFQRQKQLGVIPKNTQLTPRPQEIPAWGSLSKEQQRLYARQMEIYAGFVSHTDYEVGRLLHVVRSGAAGDNTLVLYIVGDNGAEGGEPLDGRASEANSVSEQLRGLEKRGGPEVAFNTYSSGWGWASNTPFQYWKTVASHFGGVRNPMVVSWPTKIKDVGGLRSQFAHVTDVAATIYDLVGISLPASVSGTAQHPLDGVSFAKTFVDSGALSSHGTQYFETLGNRAIYQEGWIAAARHRARDTDYSKDRWELYHVSEDFSQARDLALQEPNKLRKLQALFDQEAQKNDVYPLGAATSLWSAGKPSVTQGKREFVYFPSEHRLSEANVPPFGDVSYRMSADVVISDADTQGVLVSFGDLFGNSFAWYIQGSRLVYDNRVGGNSQRMTSKLPLPSGRVKLTYEFTRDVDKKLAEDPWLSGASGTGRLYFNETLVGEEKLASVRLWGFAASLYVGRAASSPIRGSYVQPFIFTGILEKVTVTLREPTAFRDSTHS